MESQATPKGMVSSYPQAGLMTFPQGQIGSPVQSYKWKESLQKFLKVEPKVLGTVQIMIALMNFGLGMTIILSHVEPFWRPRAFLLETGFIFWGSGFFIVSGSLCIAAENRITDSLVQSSLALNTVSSVVAGLGIIFLSVNLSINETSFYFCFRETHSESCVLGVTLLQGINIVLLILNILELFISLTVSGFGCKATCCRQSGVTILMAPPPYVPGNQDAEASKEGTMFQSPAADTTVVPGNHSGSLI